MERRLIQIDGHEFEGVPWQEVVTQFDAEDEGDEYYWEISNEVQPHVPNPYYDGDSCTRRDFPNSITLYSPKRDTATEVAIDYIACLMTQELHEGLEWVKVDGERLAQTHPEKYDGSYDYWDEMREDCAEAVRRFVAKHPLRRTPEDWRR